jgi:two-component system, OmpR family, KDP operon response regulator KdpE
MKSNELRVLVIDDELTIRNVLRLNLESQGYKVSEAFTGANGLAKAIEFHPHLVVLDLGLPDMNGLDVLKELRKWTRVPIIILTVTDDESTKVKLLDAGADDYLTKPFGTNELLARVRVSLRHLGRVEATPIFKSDGLEIDISAKKIKINDKIVKLTNTEFEVLALLVRDQGKVVTQLSIMKYVWGTTAADQVHYLRIYINQLRKKIEVNPSEPKHIITEPGIGYRLV